MFPGFLDLLIRQLDLQSLNVIFQLLNLASTDNRENPGCLGYEVRPGKGGDTVYATNFCERIRDLGSPLGFLPAHEGAKPIVHFFCALMYRCLPCLMAS